MAESVMQRSFAGGELAPAFHARADTARYLSALKTCKNFVVRREGGVENRAGFRFIRACKTTAATVMLMPFHLPDGNGMLIEVGVGYFRFYLTGALVTVTGLSAWSAVVNYVPGDLVVQGGVNYYCHTANLNQVPPNTGFWYAMPAGGIYEIPHPYGGNGLFDYNQSGAVLTLTSAFEPSHDLIFSSTTRWVVRPVTTTPAIAAPSGLGGVAGAAGTLTYRYKVTAAAVETYEESNASTTATVAACAEPTPTAPNVLTWTPVSGAAEYYVYCDRYDNGTFGFTGTASAASFNDTGFVPDFNVTPPIPRVLFTTTNNFPRHSAFHQQRRLFANTVTEPDAIYGSRVGFPSNFGIASPLQDDDAITFRIAGNLFHPVRHLLSLKQLIVFTGGGGWSVGQPGEPLTPSNLPADQQLYAGAADVKPVVVGNSVIYVQARQSIIRDAQFSQGVEGLAGRDLTVYAAHLFENLTIRKIAYQENPHSIVWCVRADGVLLGLTYLREQEVWGWHRHTTIQQTLTAQTSGIIEDVVVVPEGTEDVVYLLVARTIGGATVRYIERLAKRDARPAFFATDSFFVDSGLTYAGVPVTTVSGLSHLDGQVVAVVADGAVVFDGNPATPGASAFVVTTGAITLAVAASLIHVGLPIRYPDVELLDMDAAGSDIRDRKKRVGSVSVLVDRSSRSFSAGEDETHLRQYTLAPWDTTERDHTGQLELSLTSSATKRGRVLIRQTDPLPLTILGVIPNVDVGG